jgi:hypothetical protein
MTILRVRCPFMAAKYTLASTLLLEFTRKRQSPVFPFFDNDLGAILLY